MDPHILLLADYVAVGNVTMMLMILAESTFFFITSRLDHEWSAQRFSEDWIAKPVWPYVFALEQYERRRMPRSHG